MTESGIGRDQALVAQDQTPKLPQPSQGVFYQPPPPVAPQLTAVLMRGLPEAGKVLRCHSRARLIAVRNSSALTCWRRGLPRDGRSHPSPGRRHAC
jgi:hypothetical protein